MILSRECRLERGRLLGPVLFTKQAHLWSVMEGRTWEERNGRGLFIAQIGNSCEKNRRNPYLSFPNTQTNYFCAHYRAWNSDQFFVSLIPSMLYYILPNLSSFYM